MIRVTWEWLGQAPALDLANTVAVENGIEHDLIEDELEFASWARCEAQFVSGAPRDLLVDARAQLLDLRTRVRELLAAVASGNRPPKDTIGQLNDASSGAPRWTELDTSGMSLRVSSSGSDVDEILAWYARSAMEVVANERNRLRRCPAPSCGMFYLSTRQAQRWCSIQCGTRARVARHYHSRCRTPAA